MVSPAVSRTLRYLAGIQDDEPQPAPAQPTFAPEDYSSSVIAPPPPPAPTFAAPFQDEAPRPPPPPVRDDYRMEERYPWDPRTADQGPHEQPYPGTVSPIVNPDGSRTTERSITVTEPDLNQGRPTNIPSVWSGAVVPDDTAIQNAVASRRAFPAYDTIDDAVSVAEQRSRDLGAGRVTSVGGAQPFAPEPPPPPRPQYTGPSYGQPRRPVLTPPAPDEPPMPTVAPAQQPWRGAPLQVGPAPVLSDGDFIASQATGTGPGRDLGAAVVPQAPQSTRMPVMPPAHAVTTPARDDWRVTEPQPSPYAEPVPVPSLEAVLPSRIGHRVDALISNAQHAPSQQLDPAEILNIVNGVLPTEVVEQVISQQVGAGEWRRMVGTDPLAPFRPEAARRGITLPSAEEINPDGFSAVAVWGGLAAALALPDPTDALGGPLLGAVGRGAKRVGLPVATGLGAAAYGAAQPADSLDERADRALVYGAGGVAAGAAARHVAPRVFRGMQGPLRAGVRGVTGALDANAERMAAADARMAAEGSTAAPGVFGLSGIEPDQPAVRGLRPRIIPEDVADQLDYPITPPTDPAVIHAIEAAGGTVDERGTTLNVIRMSDPEAAGGAATRSMVFYTAGPPGAPSEYARQGTVGPQGVGGQQRIEGRTRFRNPLFISDAPGEARGFDDAVRQMGVSMPASAEEVATVQRWLSGAREQLESARRGGSPDDVWRIEGIVRGHERDLVDLQQPRPISASEVEDGIAAAKRAGPAGSAARAQALKDLVSKYGGDPDVIDDLIELRGAEMGESVYAVKENIVAGNARRAGHDGVITLKQGIPDYAAMNEHPKVVAANQALQDANAAEREAHQWVDLWESRLRLHGQGPRDASDEGWARLQRLAENEGRRTPVEAQWVVQNKAAQAEQRARDAVAEVRAAEQQARAELTPREITELADPREARNPTPGEPTAALKAAYRRAKDAERAVLEIEDSHAGALSDETYAAHMRALTEQRDANAALDALMNETDTAPGYTLRSDIPRRSPVRESTIGPSGRLAEARAAYEQALQAAAGKPPSSPEVQALMQASDEFAAAKRAGEFETTAQASAGTLPASQATDRLGTVNRALSQGVVSSVSGGVGAQVNQEMHPDDPYAAAKGFAVGALGPPLLARGGRAAARLAGAAPHPGGGALASAGGLPGPLPAATRAAQSPNPHIQNLARQMQGQYTPSGVAARPLAERIIAALSDKHAIVGAVEAETHGRITAAGNQAPVTRLAERVRVNPNSIAAQRARDELAPALQAVGDDADWLEQLLVHRHNLDVASAKGQEAYDAAIARGRPPVAAQRIADRVRTSRLFSGGMTEADITQALADIPAEIGPARFQKVEQAAQAFWDTGRASLDEKLAEGMISPAQHQELTTRYPHYVRTDIADYFEAGPAAPTPGGKTMGISSVGIKAIDPVGTAKDRVNPVLSTIDALYSHEAAVTRNAAAKDLAELRDADPTARGLFKEVAPDAQTFRGNRTEMVPPDYSLRGSEQKLTVWENGEARQFVIPGEYAALLSPRQGALLGDSAGAQGIRTFFGLWKSLITTHNPAFQMVVSPLRDVGDYAVGEATKSATKGGPLGMAQAVGALPGVVADYLKALPAAFEGLGRGQHSAEVGDLMRAGAGFEGRPARTDAGLRQAYADLRDSGGVALRSPADLARAARTILTLGAEPIGSRLELVPRIAASRRAAGRGADALGQSMAFRDATIDFNRGGWLTQQLNTVVPFINPTVQSTAQVVRLARKNPAAAAAAVGTAIGVPAMLAEAWNRSDEQRAADYADVPDSVKNTGIVIMLPDQVGAVPIAGSTELGERKPNYLWLPLGSFAFAARLAREGLGLADPVTGLRSGPERPGRRVSSPLDAAARAAEVGGELLAMFSPVKGDNLSSSVASLIPPVASEAVEIGVNKDLYRGNTIATDRADERASRLSQGVAGALNYLGDTDQVRPSQVEHVVRGVGGYAGQLAAAASDLGRDRGERRPVQDVPVVGGLASRIVRDTGGQRLTDIESTPARVPESVRTVLHEAGMRSDQVTDVGSRYRGALLTRGEQERWQQVTNAMITEEVLGVRDRSAWDDPTQRKQLVEQAVARARQKAAQEALDLSMSDVRDRIDRERARKAG